MLSAMLAELAAGTGVFAWLAAGVFNAR